jgi:hypothetical protein
MSANRYLREVAFSSTLRERKRWLAGFANVALYGPSPATPYDHRAERLVAVATK